MQLREEHALDALIVSFFCVDAEVGDTETLADPSILSEEDRKAIESLGDDLVERLLAGERPKAHLPEPSPQPAITCIGCSDVELTPECLAEMEKHRRDLLDEWED